ncbi:uncharacterized protein LOC121522750 [Cheilinus undulatus]|uniref:uncharacterized protein LOC121522750 n=1 Tax=Cheilinus undulatus TaxID=241271 RepID=UPI001BD1D6D7|nr:uncharacterized protein LOC121522750 [Cheilinus undulatus]
MLTRWITLTAFLAASADLMSAASGPSALTVTPTCRFKGHPEEELTLSCGDERKTGVVQYWHTPFGDLETPGSFSKLDPVFMHHDGSLVVPNTSSLHSGLYYCLLQHKEGATLWSYELHVSHDNEIHDEHSDYGQQNCGAFRIRRDVGSAREQEGVSDGEFAGAVAASVLLTFVVGFSAGALTRTQVLRCLRTVTMKLRSIRHQRQSDTPDHGSKINVTNLPPMYDNQAFEMEQVEMEDSTTCATIDSTISSTASLAPAKPQRSFRQKQEEQQETKAYLEGCDYMKVEEEMERRSLEENNEGCDVEEEEEKEFRGSFFFSDKEGGSQTETEEECSEDQEVREERESKEEKRQCEKEEKLENNRSSGSTEDEEESRVSTDEMGDTEKGGEENREGEEEMREEKEAEDRENKKEENAAVDICSSDNTDDDKHQDTTKNGTTEGEEEEASTSQLSQGRRSRVIRLYQYDEDGQRYGHLPQPKPNEPGPAPRLKQRSLSLTRLSAIMAAASAGPLDTRETGKDGKEERPHFHMEI